MKALTICQPYAHLIVRGQKRVENRGWATRYRGPLLIHAGKSMAWMDKDDPTQILLFKDMAFGAIVATATLADCMHIDLASNETMLGRHCPRFIWVASHHHTNGPWCWILEDVQPLAEPVPWNGQRGLWDGPDGLVSSNT